MASTGETWLRGLAVMVCGALLAAGAIHVADAIRPPRTAASALSSLSDADLNEPVTAAVALRTAARMGDRRQVSALADRLDRLAIHRGTATGWGLSYAWDAYGDGSTNPATTIYAVTTAEVGLAFLDAYEATGKPGYLRAAERAADAILARACCYGDGAAVWYSDQPQDQAGWGFVTPNVSGLAAALFLRLPSPRFHPAGQKLLDELLASREGMNWPYQYGAEKRNDLGHLCLILEGLAASPRTRPLARRVADAALRRYFDSDYTPRSGFEALGGNGAGPAAMLSLLKLLDHPSAPRLEAAIADYASPWPSSVDGARAHVDYAYALARTASSR